MASRKSSNVLKADPHLPGRYASIFEQYPGYIQFPYPLLHNPHLKAWWEKCITPLKEITAFDFAKLDLEWEGARELLVEYGEWQLTGLPVGEVKAGRVPADVVTFVRLAADDYIYPWLSPKDVRLLRTNT